MSPPLLPLIIKSKQLGKSLNEVLQSLKSQEGLALQRLAYTNGSALYWG